MIMLIPELIAEREWRANALGCMKRIEKQHLSINASSDLLNVYRTMTIPTIYAHLEGFYVSALKLLADYINDEKLSIYHVSSCLVSFSCRNIYCFLQYDQGFDRRLKFTETFFDRFNNTFQIDRALVSSKSNLNSKNLKTLLLDFGIPEEHFSEHWKVLDKLVGFRNRIAHGENSIMVNYSDYEEFIHKVIEAFDLLIYEIEQYVSKKLYLNSDALNKHEGKK